jgi:hypothetical protein
MRPTVSATECSPQTSWVIRQRRVQASQELGDASSAMSRWHADAKHFKRTGVSFIFLFNAAAHSSWKPALSLGKPSGAGVRPNVVRVNTKHQPKRLYHVDRLPSSAAPPLAPSRGARTMHSDESQRLERVRAQVQRQALVAFRPRSPIGMAPVYALTRATGASRRQLARIPCTSALTYISQQTRLSAVYRGVIIKSRWCHACPARPNQHEGRIRFDIAADCNSKQSGAMEFVPLVLFLDTRIRADSGSTFRVP